MIRRALAVLVLLAALAPGDATPQLRLADGRRLYGSGVERRRKVVRLKTAFGALDVPVSMLAGSKTAERPRAPDRAIVAKTKWFEIEHDLSPARAELYADQLDSFFSFMLRVYELDEDRVRRDAPYRMRVFRRRADFKRLQAEVAPGIEQKGKAFAEGVAGFYSAGHGKIFLWDAEGSRGGVHLEVAKHETTHLLNHLMRRQHAIRTPTWFEEGSATYFSMYLATGGKADIEPADHPGALAQVVGEIEAGTPLTSRELRAVAWADFLGRQYSWGWALVRFCRHHDRGRRWKSLLAYLRTVSAGGVTDSEERRFLKAVGFKTSEKFDEAWHEHLAGAKPAGRDTPIGTSEEVLARVAAIAKPEAELARTFAQIGMSLARARVSGPAIVYLRAALRGGVDDPEVAYLLALALAEKQGLTEDDPWPDESFRSLERAVRLAPLRADYRLGLGRQRMLRGELAAARSMLGLALVVAGPDDDDVALAMALLDASVAAAPDREPEVLVELLAREVPPAKGALRIAFVYFLQAREEWEQLAAVLQRRLKKGVATREERTMLAGLFKASDRFEEAAALYGEILGDEPGAVHLWPDRIECLFALGRREEAQDALHDAYEALRKDPRDLGWVRRRLDRLATR